MMREGGCQFGLEIKKSEIIKNLKENEPWLRILFAFQEIAIGETIPKNVKRALKKNRIAKELEDYLNRAIEKDDANMQSYIYGFIAADTGYSEEEVRDTLFGVDCGHNGLTVKKKPLPSTGTKIIGN